MQPFIAAYKDAIANNYVNFSGRLGRAGFWRFVAVNFVIQLVLSIIGRAGSFFMLIFFVYVLALVLPGVAAGIRRLHDTGRSGWWLLIGFVPIIGAIILIVFAAQPGDPNPNEYGPPPAPLPA